MTYVKRMADKISIGMAFSNMQDGNPEGEAFVSQIIADTKAACIKVIKPIVRNWEVESFEYEIGKAKVKGR